MQEKVNESSGGPLHVVLTPRGQNQVEKNLRDLTDYPMMQCLKLIAYHIN